MQSIAMLNIASSRMFFAISNRIRIAHICSSLSGSFWSGLFAKRTMFFVATDVTRSANVLATQSGSSIKFPKPVMQSLYVDLLSEPDAPPQPIHLGFSSGVNFLKSYLKSLEKIGVNHVALNLRFNQADIEPTIHRLADDFLPDFSAYGDN
ncbi:hypothetical protein [Marinobacter sp. S6332]|uniref:hypothetical protein n=1 Tax=Marinobacter sp. S6332 TaxID=2926403 RepID=UPI001FF6D1FB|nr:hypothetical protein [Marinobacter sp. S6332]MCK0165844.1 hypothetical protein [Marinobacter sp. S6332]